MKKSPERPGGKPKGYAMPDNELKILVRYHADIPKIGKIDVGDWIDLYAAEDTHVEKGEWKLISLGVSMKLPAGYEAHVVPRSSTFRRWGVVQVNSMGIIDESYCGDGDVWYFQALALRETDILKGDRICQFRIFQKMPPVVLEERETLSDPDRGGFGSTGDR